MKTNLTNTILIFVVVFFFFSCNRQPASTTILKTAIALDSIKFKCYADTIVCDMVIRNADKEDKWMEDCLGRLQRKELVDSIFEDIYNGKLIAYDFNTHNKLSLDKVKNIEKTTGYSRDIIGKFQFREGWYYDKAHHAFIKKVYSIIFGYEVYDENKNVKGYKPLFKIEF